MEDKNKTKDQLIAELSELREHITKSELGQADWFRVVAKNFNGILWAVDANLHITLSKGRRLSVFDLLEDQTVGQSLYDFYQTDDPDHPEIKHHRAVLLTGETIEYEATSAGTDFLSVISPIKKADEIIGVLGIAIDVTQRKQAEEALQKSEKLLREAQQIGKLGHWTRDIETDAGVWSDEVYRIFGLQPGSLQPSLETFESMIHPDDLEDFLRDRERMLNEKKKAYLEYRIIHPDGEIHHVVQRTEAEFDEEGNVARIFGIVQDITEQSQAQEQQRLAHQQFEIVMDSLDALVYVADMETYEVLFLNKFGREVFGEPDGKVCWQMLQSGQSGPCSFCTNDRLLDVAGKPTGVYQWEFQNTVDQKVYDCRDQAIPWTDGRLVRMEIAIDVTDRKRIEDEILHLNAELEQRVAERTSELSATIKEIESFSYSISHNLRAPLRAMIGFSEILLNDYAASLDDEIRDYLDRIHGAGQNMNDLITDLLALSHLSRKELTFISFSPDVIATQIFEKIQATGNMQDIKFSTHKCSDIVGDRNLITILLTNLISNSIKFTQKERPASIEFGCMEEEGRSVFFLRDNGVGFNMAYADKLFAPFQSLHSPEEYDGTGIGLAIAHQVIQNHKGEIWAESEEGKGATIYFTIGSKMD